MASAPYRRGRTSRLQRATALLPLVLLSGAWSANAHDGDGEVRDISVPGVPEIPVDVFDQPGSVTLPDTTSSTTDEQPSVRSSADARRSSLGSASSGIPAAALGAYHRAASILNQADAACNLDWTLLAAIGRVESDHGRFGGSTLNEQGKASPPIYGLPLSGQNGTARILDSDGGLLDNDAVYDRAVGPMQFIPSTWRAAGVDADRDGSKDPQDIDDAATASAVYLCAGSEDLSTRAGQRAAVYRYNQNDTYVDVVLSIAEAYARGDYSAVPNGSLSSPLLRAEGQAAGKDSQRRQAGKKNSGGRHTEQTTNRPQGTATISGSDGSDDNGSPGPNDRSGHDGTTDNRDSGGSGKPPADDQDNTADKPTGDVKKTLGDATQPVKKTVVGAVKAAKLCTDKLTGALDGAALDQAVRECADEITGKTLRQATTYLDQPVKSLLKALGLDNLLDDLLGGLLGG